MTSDQIKYFLHCLQMGMLAVIHQKIVKSQLAKLSQKGDKDQLHGLSQIVTQWLKEAFCRLPGIQRQFIVNNLGAITRKR